MLLQASYSGSHMTMMYEYLKFARFTCFVLRYFTRQQAGKDVDSLV